MRLVVVIALAGCGAKVHHPPVPDPEDEAEPIVPLEETAPVEPAWREPPLIAAADPPAECAADGWSGCYQRALTLLAGPDAAIGMGLLRASCEEGDRRRCFERDRPMTAFECLGDRHADACHQLAVLYQEGRATCPPDLDCATMLDEMACIGGAADSCLPPP